MKKFWKYMSLILIGAGAGLVFTPIGAVIGAVIGYFVARKSFSNAKFNAGLAKRMGISENIWGYIILGLTGFIFFSYVGIFVGVALYYAYRRFVVKKKW